MASEQLGKHVLVVNDSPELLALFQELLEDEGYRVSTRCRAFTCVEEVEEARPDLLLLDVMAGDEDDGWRFVETLKWDPDTARLPIVVCTGAVSSARRMEAWLRAMGVGLVLKPFDIDDLLAELQRTSNGRVVPEPPVGQIVWEA